jgi:uncharacterized protein (DUF952 family)
LIFHIVEEKEYLRLIGSDAYFPAGFSECGFVHCALEGSVVSIADDYYSSVEERLLLLMIDPSKLQSETRYEAAVPGQGAGTRHLSTSPVFPHIYGPINFAAVEGVGILHKEQHGYVWPKDFISLDEYLKRMGKSSAGSNNKP